MKIDRISIGTLFLSLIAVLMSVCGQQADAETLTGHAHYVFSVAFSPNGQTIASGSWDDTIRLWDVNTGTELKKITGNTSNVLTLAFSPNGQTIASGSSDNTVRLWDVNTGTELKKFTGHTRTVYSVAFSPNGQTIASGSSDDTIRLWDVNTGTQLKKFTGHTENVRSVAFSPNGQTIASGSSDDTIRLWDVNTGTQLKKFTGHTENVRSVAFSPNGQTIASGSSDDTIRLWDVNTGTQLKKFTGHTENVRSVTFSPNGQTIASGSNDNTVRLWDVNTGTELKKFTGHTWYVLTVAFSPIGQTIASGSWDRTIRLWDVNTGTERKEITGHNTDVVPLVSATDLDLSHRWDVRCVAYSPGGVVLASGGTDDYMRLWRVSNGKALDTYKHGGDINSIAFSPNDTWIASGSDDGKVRLYKWSTADDTWVDSEDFDMPGGVLASNVTSVAFSYDNTMLACGTRGSEVFVWDYDQDQDKWIQRSLPLGKHSKAVNSVAFSPWGVVLASASDDKTVRLWHARTGELLDTLDNHTEGVNCVTFSRDDAFIASGSDDDTVILWKWSASDDTWVFHELLDWHDDDVRSVAFNPNGAVLLSASADRTIGVWDGRTGDYRTSLVEHTESVNSIACNFQGNAIASGSDDGKVRQLAYTEAADIAAQGISLTLPADFISDIAFAPNATYFILNVQFPSFTGALAADVIYEDCVIIIDFPDVPTEPVAKSDDTDPRLDNPDYFMYPLATPRERLSAVDTKVTDELRSALKIGLASAATSFVVGLVVCSPSVVATLGIGPVGCAIIGSTAGFIVGFGTSAIKIFTTASQQKSEILRSTADPVFFLKPSDFGDGAGRPPSVLDVLFLFRKQLKETIQIKVVQTFRLKSKTRALWYDPTYTVTYDGTLNLEDGTLAAPGVQPMTLSDYPPFQLLPPDVQEYLLRLFGEFMITGERQVPETTALLSNYPNPFNPETWVPYQLAKPADVTLTIYDINGRVVRALDLGHQRAGMYHSRTRAAHWDGKNEVGESVASGIYFYVLKAGDFTATRKMLIKK